MFGELLSKSNLLRGSQTELSDLINQRGINSDFNITNILNDERNDERSQEIAAAYSKFFRVQIAVESFFFPNKI